MNFQLLKDTVSLIFADDKGLLAMDESNGTCNKRFESSEFPQTVELAKSLSRIDCDHSRVGRVDRRCNPFRRNHSPAEERRHTLC